MLSHQNLIAQFLQVRSLCSDDQKVMLAVLPMYHGMPLPNNTSSSCSGRFFR